MTTEDQSQPLDRITIEALRLYRPPFRCEHGYIWDANNEMVADDEGRDTVLRIRGWGRIGYQPNPEQLQDKVGKLIARAMTEFWKREWQRVLADPSQWDIRHDDVDALLKVMEQS